MHIFFFLGHAHFIQLSEVKGKKIKGKKNEKNVLLCMGCCFFFFALILPPHPWHHTLWCQNPWGSPEDHNFLVVLWFPALLLRRVWSSSYERRQEGRGFHSGWRPQNSAPGFPVGYQHLVQPLPSPCWGTARFGKAKWWWNTSLRKCSSLETHCISFCVCICLSNRGEPR